MILLCEAPLNFFSQSTSTQQQQASPHRLMCRRIRCGHSPLLMLAAATLCSLLPVLTRAFVPASLASWRGQYSQCRAREYPDANAHDHVSPKPSVWSGRTLRSRSPCMSLEEDVNSGVQVSAGGNVRARRTLLNQISSIALAYAAASARAETLPTAADQGGNVLVVPLHACGGSYCLQVHEHPSIHTHPSIHVCIHTYIHAHIRRHTHTHTHTHTHIHTSDRPTGRQTMRHMHNHTQTHTHLCTHTHIHTQTYVSC